MNIIRALFPYNRESPLHWLTFDTVSGQMIDCSMHPTHKQRELYQGKHYRINKDKIEMRCEVEVYQERKFESLTEIQIGE
ncbi:hypothetical protein GCM10016272_02240 [Psychrobacter glaciei]|uniref:Uncharacterized protein n=1 Tax=Psychrobacter glaciei TaxID=619771 RepID=A0ABQ3GNU6_9GAMM|nr:hypothetical protein [Psychrobacter glaciei]GHD25905.1 hypothetical protein GCM10016272_02240 [Psychrobacter glaciei]